MPDLHPQPLYIEVAPGGDAWLPSRRPRYDIRLAARREQVLDKHLAALK
jgi:hypothetical protein